MDTIALQATNVLIVDDCHDSAQSLSLLLAHWGHKTCVAYDGVQALQLAETSRPEIVLLDLAMPHMSGLELARRLRRDLHLDDALLVSMSGFGQEEYRQAALEAGCDCHFIKPIDPDILRQLLAAPRNHLEIMALVERVAV